MSSDVAGIVDGTPARFVPEEMRGQLIEAEHTLRYWWAGRLCEGCRVLDAGCGTGYGAAALKHSGAAEVIAVDISEPVIEVARQSVPAGVTCEVADIASLPYSDHRFDTIVCFETIEHVEDAGAALDELARVLAPGGLLVISSPNRARYVSGNPHHRQEFLPEELRAELAARFPEVRLVGQHAMMASVLGADSDEWSQSASVRRLASPEAHDPTYTLALAGRTVPDPGPPLVALTQFFEVRQWLERYQEQQRVLVEQAEMLSELQAARNDRREALALLAERERELAAQVELEARIMELEARNRQAQEVIAGVQRSLGWRLTAPLRRATEALRVRLTAAVAKPLEQLEALLIARAKRFLETFLADRRR